MRFYADLHVHSRYARATSRNADLAQLAWWARRKGITVLGTGDFTHPAWFAELEAALVPAEPGLYRLRDELDRAVVDRLPPSCRGPLRLLLAVEVATAFRRDGRARRMHHLLYAPDLRTAARLSQRLGRSGNLVEDGRPTLALDARDLLEATLASGDGAYLVPAHIWTPWMGVLSATTGFDSIEACYGELVDHIFAVETGLSADPPMNRRVSALDHFAIRRALETGEGYGGTVEIFPEAGRYHLSGHRRCGVRLDPEAARRSRQACPVCGKRLTMGVQQRVENLADRPAVGLEARVDCRSLVPLPELVGEVLRVGPASKAVARMVDAMIERLGPELPILERLPVDAIRDSGFPEVADAIDLVQRGLVVRDPGFDGEYGAVHLARPTEPQPVASSPKTASD